MHRTALLVLLLAVSPVQAQDIRVRLLDLDEPVTVDLSAHDGSLRLYAGAHTDPLTELSAGDVARISRAGDQLRAAIGDLVLFAWSLRVVPVDDAVFGLEIPNEGAAPERRRYAGRLIITPNGPNRQLDLVNEAPLEEYVASVVATEYGFDDAEGSKAMAVVVRTYALEVSNPQAAAYDHVDHTLSQVYLGADAVTPASREAARETEGEVLTYDDKLIRAVYFASSGGHTADNETVWDGPPRPYLRGKPDPYGSEAPHARWSSRISREQLLSELRGRYGSDVDGFLIGERSDDGRVSTVTLISTDGERRSISANEFRLLVNGRFGVYALRSADFDARRVGDEYVVEGRGFGHGVGLSQWGAHDMALRGMSYRDILDFYYTDVSLARLDGRRPGPEAPAQVVSSPEDPSPPPERRRRIGW